MKYQKIKLLLSGVAGVALFAASTSAQFYNFAGSVTTGDGNDLSASGSILFVGSTVTVSMLNDSPDPSRISKFYLLKPFDNSGARIGATSLFPVVTSDGNNDWSLDAPLPNEFNNFSPNNDLYFGADSDSTDDSLQNNQNGQFTFNLAAFDAPFDWGAYESTEDALLFVRWQTVGEPAGDGEDSGKGAFFFLNGGDGEIIPVPEPSHIAILALAGLGGILWTRRRVARKSC